MSNAVIRRLISLVYPDRCPYCNRVTEHDAIACDRCSELLPKSYLTTFAFGGFFTVSTVPYKDMFAASIQRLKFDGKRGFARPLAMLMQRAMSDAFEGEKSDLITCVPLHPKTLKARGFNQSELLAKSLSELSGIPYAPLLKKTRYNEPQHTLSAQRRKKNVLGAYRLIDQTAVKDKRILLIDDIITTGHTMGECARVLDSGGAASVNCLTYAMAVAKTT